MRRPKGKSKRKGTKVPKKQEETPFKKNISNEELLEHINNLNKTIDGLKKVVMIKEKNKTLKKTGIFLLILSFFVNIVDGMSTFLTIHDFITMLLDISKIQKKLMEINDNVANMLLAGVVICSLLFFSLILLKLKEFVDKNKTKKEEED